MREEDISNNDDSDDWIDIGPQLVTDFGAEDRAIFRTKKIDVHSEIVSIFERLIRRLSHPSISAEKDLGWLLTETKKYILPDTTPVEKVKRRKTRAIMKVRREKIRLMEEIEAERADRATQEAKKMSKMTAKELRSLARLYEVKGRSKAKSKVDLVQLLEANYGDMRRDYHERRRRRLESEAIQRGEPMMDEPTRWNQEIIEEESRRQPPEPARP